MTEEISLQFILLRIKITFLEVSAQKILTEVNCEVAYVREEFAHIRNDNKANN